MRIMRKVASLLVLAGGLAVVIVAGAASKGSPGFTTAQPPMLEGVAAAGSSYERIISVGDTLQGGYMFESIPDGIAFSKNGQGTVDVFVNHETSTVPFPYSPATGIGFNDFTNAMVSELRLSQNGGGVLPHRRDARWWARRGDRAPSGGRPPRLGARARRADERDSGGPAGIVFAFAHGRRRRAYWTAWRGCAGDTGRASGAV